MVIGICGGSASGKTTLLNRLHNELKFLRPSIFSMDNYYFPIEQQQKDTNGKINFDLPTALDQKMLISDLDKLRKGISIEVKEYRFNAPPNTNNLITIDSSSVIIVEGLFLFYYEKVRSLLDFSIFMEVEPTVQLDRRLDRDQNSRGYSREAIIYQWENHVLPCYKKHLEPYEELANFRFKNDNRADDEFERLMNEIELLVAKKKMK